MVKVKTRRTLEERSPWARGTAFVDGVYVPLDQANISILDPGFLHSDVTYDVAHVWNGSFFRLEDQYLTPVDYD